MWKKGCQRVQWWIQNFPDRDGNPQRWGRQRIIWRNVSLNCMGVDQERGVRPACPLDPPRKIHSYCIKVLDEIHTCDPKGAGDACPALGPISVIFMQFSSEILLNNRLTPPSLGLSPRRNPGSATVKHSVY